MNIILTAILLALSVKASAYDQSNSKSTAEIYKQISTQNYYNQERIHEQKELEALKESNDIAREQLKLEREILEEEKYQRELDSIE